MWGAVADVAVQDEEGGDGPLSRETRAGTCSIRAMSCSVADPENVPTVT